MKMERRNKTKKKKQNESPGPSTREKWAEVLGDI